MKKSKLNVRWMCQLALLIAIVLVMSYTPLGYLQVGVLSMSLISIPVAVGAMLMGPGAGAVLGCVFGLTSFLNAMEGKSAMGTAMVSENIVGAFITCVIARTLMGATAGVLYWLACKLFGKQSKAACVVGGVAAPLFNTVYFMGFLMLLFYNGVYVQGLLQTFGVSNVWTLVIAMVGGQAVVEWVGCGIISTAVTVPLRKILQGKTSE